MPVKITLIEPYQYKSEYWSFEGITRGLVLADGTSHVTITAKVTDNNGDPVPNVVVTFEQKKSDDPNGPLGTFLDLNQQPADTATTDAQGEAQILLRAPNDTNAVDIGVSSPSHGSSPADKANGWEVMFAKYVLADFTTDDKAQGNPNGDGFILYYTENGRDRRTQTTPTAPGMTPQKAYATDMGICLLEAWRFYRITMGLADLLYTDTTSNSRFRCIIKEIGVGRTAWTDVQPVNPQGRQTSDAVIRLSCDNPYIRSDDPNLPSDLPHSFAAFIACHELFHAFQFRYDVNQESWLVEGTAQIAPEFVWPDNNWWFRSVGTTSFASGTGVVRQFYKASLFHPKPIGYPASLPLECVQTKMMDAGEVIYPPGAEQSMAHIANRQKEYGTSAFFRWAAEKYGRQGGGLGLGHRPDPLVIRTIWEKTKTGQASLHAVMDALVQHANPPNPAQFKKQIWTSFRDDAKRPRKYACNGPNDEMTQQNPLDLRNFPDLP